MSFQSRPFQATGRPQCWTAYQTYYRSLVESPIFLSLADSFTREEEKFAHLKSVLGDLLQEPKMMDDFPEVWDEAAISKATEDLLDLPDVAVVQTLKAEKMGGSTLSGSSTRTPSLLSASPSTARRA